MNNLVEFTDRELEIIRKVSLGKSNKEIGEELFISFHTVKAHLENIYNKISVHNRIQLIVYAFKNKIIM